MAGAYVVVKRTKTAGRRYQVRYWLGGRESKQYGFGTFSTRKEAEARAQVARLAIAQGKVPELALERDESVVTMREWAERYIASRKENATASTLRVMRNALGHFDDTPLGAKAPALVTREDVQAWVATVGDGRAPSTVKKYLALVQVTLDFAGRQKDNPARDRFLQLPTAEAEEIAPPVLDHVCAVLDAISPRYRLHLRLLEATGLRVGEAMMLRFEDLDVAGLALRIAPGRTKGRTKGVRSVPVPPELTPRSL